MTVVADDDWEKILPYVLPIIGTIIWPFIWPNIWPIVWPIMWPLKWPGTIGAPETIEVPQSIGAPGTIGNDIIFDKLSNDDYRPDSSRDSSTTTQYVIIGTFSAVVFTIAAVLTGYSYSKRPSSLEMRLRSMPRAPSATVTPHATTSFAEPAQVIISVDLVKN